MKTEDRYDSLIRYYAERFGRNPLQVKRQIRAESSFNPDAKSPAGCYGLAQFNMMTWSQWWDGDSDLDPPPADLTRSINPQDPEDAILALCAYMASLEKRFGSLAYALAAYNWGPGHMSKLLSAQYSLADTPKETQDYVAKCLAFAQEVLVC